MKGKLFVDGEDAYEKWGVFVTSDGWNEAIAYPPLKAVDSNDWQEEDGIEVDLSEPRLNTAEMTIQFAISGIFSRYEEFVNVLTDGAYHTFNAASIKRTFKLRMVQMPNLDYALLLGFVSIRFANDFPLSGYTYLAPSSSMTSVEDYLLDGIPFTNYGCRILQGSLSEVMKAAAVKQNLLRNIPTKTGAIYDGAKVTYKQKEVKLNCLMRATTLEELWRNYDALLYDLVRPEERMLDVAEIEQVFPCHYKSATVSGFYPEGKIWLTFTLTLVFTRDFRSTDTDLVLAAQSGTLIETQETDTSLIQLTPNEED